MSNKIYIIILLAAFTIQSCNKKSHPTKSPSNITVKPIPKKVVTPTPKVIVVDDKVARRTIDGRYYYDLEGHRYWRNNKDGKYYLYNKSMYADPAFKSQKSKVKTQN